MKVIRSYNDYYDGVLSNFAQEQVPFYNRKAIKIDDLEYNELRRDLPDIQGVTVVPYKDDMAHISKYRFNNQIDLSTAVIGFCGKLYIVFYSTTIGGDDGIPVISYPTTEILNDSFAIVKRSYYLNEYKIKIDKSNVQLIIDRWINEKILLDLFIKYKVPSFAYTNKGLTLNPCLKDFNIQKVIHPYTVVQELEMFLNNDLCDTVTPPMPVGNDVVIAQSKGYDKWSFRKMPKSKKTKNKKEPK